MILLFPILTVISAALGLLRFALMAYIILGWLVAFDVVNRNNKFVHSLGTMLSRLLEPILTPIRNKLPNFGGLDLSPIAVFFAIMFMESLIVQIALSFGASQLAGK